MGACGLLCVVVAATGCQRIGYLTHLGAGQVRALWAREPLTPEREAALSDEQRAGLRVLREALTWARELGLAESTSYRHVIDRSGRHAVHVVVAAEPTRLEPISWWFPITGEISYRGYFGREPALRFAAELAAEGLDTYVRPALLYSTLGFFDDPIPLAMLRWADHDIFDTILHERLHETVFVAGDLDYNEGLATFVGRRATLAWIGDDTARAEAARATFADQQRFAALVGELAAELQTLYEASPEPADPEGLATRRAGIFARFQGERFARIPWQTDRYAGFPQVELSNAWVVAHQTYVGLLPCFAAQLDALGGDLRAFIAAHRDRPGRPAGCADAAS